MCGIVAYIGKNNSVPVLVEGLRRLEYRGYDSAGVAVVTPSGLRVHKAKGTVRHMEESLPKRLKGTPGIGHTRWATHGEPSDANAHPHLDASRRIAVVHNGIIENAGELRDKLEADGVEFRSQTDTEVLAHLIAQYENEELQEAVRQALSRIEGTYGIAVLDANQPDRLVVARHGSPVLIGIGNHEMLAASDESALVRHCTQVVHLDDGEIATLTAEGYETTTLDARSTVKVASPMSASPDDYDKAGYEHFMRKEIHEQPVAVDRTLQGRIDDRFATVHFGGLNLTVREAVQIRRVKIVGCGSAYYSGQLGAQLIEELARLPADAEPASEFRYRNPVIEADTLYIAVSQSGETFDTLWAVQEIRRKGGRVLGVVNAVGSTIARECDGGVYIHAGPEISVTSTKTFTSTAVVFALLAVHLGRVRDLSPAEGMRIINGLRRLPEQIQQILDEEDRIAELALHYATFPSLMYIGRVRGYPIAREGAQKLKEVSYLHAEAYPASELKHGPLALIGLNMPTVAIVPDDELYEKNLATLGEIKARSGPILSVGHTAPGKGLADDVILVPRNEPELDPILLGIPLQLLAYHSALTLGHDVDKPRNLAKSVTVE